MIASWDIPVYIVFHVMETDSFMSNTRMDTPIPCMKAAVCRRSSELLKSFITTVVFIGQNWRLRLPCSGHACSRCSAVILQVWQGHRSDWPIPSLVKRWWFWQCSTVHMLVSVLYVPLLVDAKVKVCSLSRLWMEWCIMFLFQVASLVNIASNYLNAGQEASRHGTSHPSIVPYQVEVLLVLLLLYFLSFFLSFCVPP